jgi:hypothetical protein
MELPREERQALDYSACDADDLAALTAEVLPDEDWTMPEGSGSNNRRKREGEPLPAVTLK